MRWKKNNNILLEVAIYSLSPSVDNNGIVHI